MSSENTNEPINIAAEMQQKYALGERNFRKANLAAADLRDIDLRGADLQGANLMGAFMRGANLKEANLKEAFLKECDLRAANLSAADLKGASLNGAYLELTMLQRAKLEKANLKGANLGGAMLMGASLEGADLTFADLSDTYMIAQGGSGGANLEGANLKGAEFRGANLKGANLNGANLKEAKLKGAYPQGAYYDGKTIFPGGFDPASSGMLKSKNSSSKKPSSSAQGLKPIYSVGGVAGIATMLVSVMVFRIWVETNRAKTALTAKAEPDITIAAEAGRPVTEAEIHAKMKSGRPVTEAEIEAKLEASKPKPALAPEANKSSAMPKSKVSVAANKTKPVTKGAQRKTQAAAFEKVASCPVLVRVINAASPDKPLAVDVSVNGKKVLSKIPFSQASRYISVLPGKLLVQIRQAGTKKMVGEKTFAAAANSAYSVAVTGPLPGPKAKFNKSPFVILEDLSSPRPGKFKGGWYNLSETKGVNELRIAKYDAANVDVARLVKLMPKTTVDYPQLKAGIYNFNPVLSNQSSPLANSASKPPMRVEIAKAKIPAGTIFDVFATDNTLGKGRNSLKLSAASYKTFPRTAVGCIRVL